jgi:L-seryl-tRNA(Ser) seleniumtransferase
VSAGTLAQRLRTGTPAVVARVRKGHVLFDLRTVLAEQTAELVRTITQALA